MSPADHMINKYQCQKLMIAIEEYSARDKSLGVTHDPSNNKLTVHDHEKNIITLRYPAAWGPYPQSIQLNQLANHLTEDPSTILIVLIHAGYAAIGTLIDNQLAATKMIRKYMVRKTQGKAQLTYLNTKGKSRLGSRIRLSRSIEFFQEINQEMDRHINWEIPERIIYSASPRIWSMIFQSQISCPFEKDDPRLLKLSMHVHRPNREELERVGHWTNLGNIVIQSEYLSIYTKFLEQINSIIGNPSNN